MVSLFCQLELSPLSKNPVFLCFGDLKDLGVRVSGRRAGAALESFKVDMLSSLNWGPFWGPFFFL